VDLSERFEEVQAAEDIIVLEDEDGNITRYELLDLINVDDREYVLLAPLLLDDEEVEIVILRFEDDDFFELEDEQEFNEVTAALEELRSYDEYGE
jgi:uncharacterized protein YrzB (UPF0473 family)